MKIVVAITAASGGIYARLTLERLLRSSEVSQIALVCSACAREVLAHEDVVLPEDGRIRLFGNDDLFAPPASGSSRRSFPAWLWTVTLLTGQNWQSSGRKPTLW